MMKMMKIIINILQILTTCQPFFYYNYVVYMLVHPSVARIFFLLIYLREKDVSQIKF